MTLCCSCPLISGSPGAFLLLLLLPSPGDVKKSTMLGSGVLLPSDVKHTNKQKTCLMLVYGWLYTDILPGYVMLWLSGSTLNTTVALVEPILSFAGFGISWRMTLTNERKVFFLR